jgi:hypothetical protein
MTIEKVFAHLVYPNHKGDVPTPYTASEVPLEGKLFGLIKKIYDDSELECNIDIQFEAVDQRNEMRELILDFLSRRNADAAGKFAERLASVTTRRSQLGLFFVVLAKASAKDTVLFSRFPTDQAILADDKNGGLNIEFLEKVFVKKWSTYKGAIFSDTVSRSGFWSGRIVDRQINSADGEASQYWVEKFLGASFVATKVYGTTRFARALSAASRSGSFAVQTEINSSVPFLRQYDGKVASIDDISERLGFSQETKEAIKREMPSGTENISFMMDYSVLRNSVTFRTIKLSNGVSVTADSAEFQELVSIETKETTEGQLVTLSTSGKLLADRLTKAQ